MASDDLGQLRHFQSLYLSPNGADIWFIIDGERIPSHKLILMTTIPSCRQILAENGGNDEIHVAGVSIESFKEFLKFVYLVKPSLTTDNIEGVMDMANRWKSCEIFTQCETFLKQSLIETSTLFIGYRLAIEYKAMQLKKLFETEICAKASDAFKTASFLTLPQEYLIKILECNTLACKEVEVFDACIEWATAACIRNGLDSLEAEHLRAQLGDSVYQIRFNSMTNKDAAACINSHGQLFTVEELEEIACMVGHRKQYKAKKFNWTARNWDLSRKCSLKCSRLRDADDCQPIYQVENPERTQFTCDRDIVLQGIELEMLCNVEQPIHIRIVERNQDLHSHECYNERATAQFRMVNSVQLQPFHLNLFVARIPLVNGILLRKNFTYIISIAFDNQNLDLVSRRTLKTKVRVDHDICVWFSSRGIVSSLLFRRFDKRSFAAKIIYSPAFWLWLIGITMALCFGSSVYLLPNFRTKILNFWPILWPKIQFTLYTGFGLLMLFKYRDNIGTFLRTHNSVPILDRFRLLSVAALVRFLFLPVPILVSAFFIIVLISYHFESLVIFTIACGLVGSCLLGRFLYSYRES